MVETQHSTLLTSVFETKRLISYHPDVSHKEKKGERNEAFTMTGTPLPGLIKNQCKTTVAKEEGEMWCTVLC